MGTCHIVRTCGNSKTSNVFRHGILYMAVTIAMECLWPFCRHVAQASWQLWGFYMDPFVPDCVQCFRLGYIEKLKLCQIHIIVFNREILWCLMFNFTISTCRNIASNSVLSVLLATILIQLGAWCTCANFTLGSVVLNRVHRITWFDYSLCRLHNFQVTSVRSLWAFHSQFTLVRILLCTQPQNNCTYTMYVADPQNIVTFDTLYKFQLNKCYSYLPLSMNVNW